MQGLAGWADGERATSHGEAGSLGPSPRLASCIGTVRTDYNRDDQCYVLHLAHLLESDMVASSLTTGIVKLFSPDASGLRFVGDLKAHDGARVTALCAPDPAAGAPAPLYTGGSDGVVRAWDPRSGGVCQKFRAAVRGEAQAVAAGPALVAAGVGEAIALWDARTGRQAALWSDTHAEDVTAVRLHPTAPGALVSGSEDGIVGVFDVSGDLDEEESFKAALNLSTAAADIGFYGAGRLWCTTGTETLQLWEWEAACVEEAGGGQGALADVDDARQRLSALTPALGEGLHYLLGCAYDAASGVLCLAAGTVTGEVGLYPVVERPVPAPGLEPGHLGAPLCLLGGVHTDIVRCALSLGGTRFVTGGEDARLCLWDLSGVAGGQSPSTSGAPAAPGSKHTRRASPY